VCREYDCNTDYLLQIALRVGVTNIVQLSRDAMATNIPRDQWLTVPGCDPTS